MAIWTLGILGHIGWSDWQLVERTNGRRTDGGMDGRIGGGTANCTCSMSQNNSAHGLADERAIGLHDSRY